MAAALRDYRKKVMDNKLVFSGGEEPSLLDWLRWMKRTPTSFDGNIGAVLPIIPMLLTGDALAWYDERDDAAEEEPFATFAALEEAMRARFLPVPDPHVAIVNLFAASQGEEESVDSNTDAFKAHLRKVRTAGGGTLPDRVQSAMFVEGLHPKLKGFFTGLHPDHKPGTVDAAAGLARHFELERGRQAVFDRPPSPPLPPGGVCAFDPPPRGTRSESKSRGHRPPYNCYICGEGGHGVLSCRWLSSVRKYVSTRTKAGDVPPAPGEEVAALDKSSRPVEARPFVEVMVGRRLCRFLVDSGAGVSVVSPELAEHLAIDHRRRGPVIGVSGTKVPVLGTAAGMVEVGGDHLPLEAVILEHLGSDGILGVPELFKWGISLAPNASGGMDVCRAQGGSVPVVLCSVSDQTPFFPCTRPAGSPPEAVGVRGRRG